MTTQRPNILMLLCDNQRADTLGILGKTPCQTPTWDRVAREGVLFENLRCTSPLCSPTRASLFTGLQPHQAGMPYLPYSGRIHGTEKAETDAEVVREITRPPISHYLREIGYHCLYAGKWHLGADNITRWFDWAAACDQDDRDYGEWCRGQGIPDGRIFHDDERSALFRSRHPPRMSMPRTAVLDIPEDKEFNKWVLDHAFELFGLRKREQPFFMVASMEGPHPPLIVPEAYYDMYDPEAIPEPSNWQARTGEPTFLASSYYRRLRHEWGDDFAAWRKSVAVYWGFVTYIDSLFGRLLEHLEQAGGLDNTLVVMLSDHGEMMGQHGLWQKFCPYEEAVRVPWVMRWPGVIPTGSRCTMDVSHVDVAPTLLSAAGVDVEPLDLEGENLLPYLAGGREEPAARDCFTQYNLAPDFKDWHGVENWRMILRRPWKFVLHENGDTELYDIINDQSELKNRAGDSTCKQTAVSLEEELLAWSRRTGDPFAERVEQRGQVSRGV